MKKDLKLLTMLSIIQFDLINSLILFGMLQALLVIFVFVHKQRFGKHKYLVFFVGTLFYVQMHAFLIKSRLMYEWTFLLNSDVPFIFLFGPLAYAYTTSLLGKNLSTKKLIIHSLAFLFYLAYSFNFFLQPIALKQNVLIRMLALEIPYHQVVNSFPFDPWNIQGWVVVEFLALHVLGYALYSLYSIYKASKEHTDKSFKNQRLWLAYFNGMLLTGGLVMFFAKGGVVNGYVFFESPFPNFTDDLFGTFAMYFTSLLLISRPEFLEVKKSSKKYRKSSLPQDFSKEKIKKLKDLIETEKLYLSPDFSLDLLASKSGINKHHISQLINQELQSSFYELSNQYRVAEAKRILAQSEYIKMEQLAYQLGYKSKSSFFKAFKKATELTPSKYAELVHQGISQSV